MVLNEGGGKKRQWVFDTPRGSFEVLSRAENPVWRKPDWAFVEEGQPIPKNPGDRLDYGSLGEYALYFGNGYMIHGTLYERLLGRAVSHGCIRVGRDDLRKVWAASRSSARTSTSTDMTPHDVRHSSRGSAGGPAGAATAIACLLALAAACGRAPAGPAAPEPAARRPKWPGSN